MSAKNFKIKKITVIGVIPSFAFQRAKQCTLELHKSLPQRYPLPEIRGMLEFDWNEKLQEWKRVSMENNEIVYCILQESKTMDRDFWCIRRPVVVFFDDKYIGNDIDLLRITSLGDTYYENIPRKNMLAIKQDMKHDYYTYLKKSKRVYCFLDVCIDEVYVGALTFQLYSDLLPKTCQNFKELCLGPYKGSLIHRVVKNGWVQGGEIEEGVPHFEDECYAVSHDRKGIISMVSNGKNRIKSEFFITLNPTPWLDRYYVAFGQLVEGVEALEAIAKVKTIYENPVQKIEIKNCGELILEEENPEEVPKMKKRKRIETIAEQLTRMIMEAVTDVLSSKEYPPDVLDERDVPSEMDLQLYFQGFYSIPFDTVEEVAAYLRQVQRDYLRYLQPEATEIVETVTYNILDSVLTNLTTLDDVRETLGKSLYEKLIKDLSTEVESVEQSQVQKFLEQVISTAKSMIKAIGRKLDFLRKNSKRYKKFQEGIEDWLRDFVLQKRFLIFYLPETEGEVEEEKKEEMNVEEDEICRGEVKDENGKPVKLTSADFFSDCRYDIKYVNKLKKRCVADLIEACREDLKTFRNQPADSPIDYSRSDLIDVCRENLKAFRDQTVESPTHDSRLEEKLTKYLTGVSYGPETEWIRDLIFDKDDKINHVDEILCGSLTMALLEMYYLYEEYLKKGEQVPPEEITAPEAEEIAAPETKEIVMIKAKKITPKKKPPKEIKKEIIEPLEVQPETEIKEVPCPPCKCADSVCDCTCDPNWSPQDEIPLAKDSASAPAPPLPPPPPPPPSEEPESTGPEENVAITDLEESPCPPGTEPFYVESLLTDRPPEPINLKSFKWLGDYILNQGCETKSKLAQRIHDWLNGEDFNYSGLISKHSLATRASLLSLSFSMASLIRENNEFKTEIRNFIYDLWCLYFSELFKESLLEMGDENVEIEDERTVPPYVLPFWIKFVMEISKKALGAMAKVSVLPNRLFVTTESELAFDENMKIWFESDVFRQTEPSGKDILEYISYHKVGLENLDDTVRSYLKKKVYAGLMHKNKRKASANKLANGVIMDLIGNVIKQSDVPPSSIEAVVTDLIATSVNS